MAAPHDRRAQLLGLVTGHIVTQCIYCVAELGVVDAIPAGADAPVDEIAAAVGANADALYRVLRTLAASELFTETSPRTFAVAELGELLRDGEFSMRYVALMHGAQTMPLFVHMLDTVRTGLPVTVVREGRTRWEILADDPAQSEVFNRAMRGRSVALRETAFLVDWQDIDEVVDVGGGTGGILLPLLQHVPHLRGVLFDLEHVVADAAAAVEAAGVADRCELASGSFFESVPDGADAYLLSNVLHDWGDEDATRILRTCRAAARDDSKLVVLENLLPEGDEPHPAWMLDMQMLVAIGGRERTQSEFRGLLRGGGFELEQIVGDRPVALVARPV